MTWSNSTISLLFIGLCITSCGEPTIRVKTEADWLHRPGQYHAVTGLPHIVDSHLHYVALDKNYAQDSWSTLLKLDSLWRQNADEPTTPPAEKIRSASVRRGVSYVLAACAYHYASNTTNHEQQTQAMTTALCASYTFLFENNHADLPTAPIALDLRTNDAREIHNRSLAWIALRIQAQNSSTRIFDLPMIGGTLQLQQGTNDLPFNPKAARRFDPVVSLHIEGSELPVIGHGLGTPMVLRIEQESSDANLVCAATVLIKMDSMPGVNANCVGKYHVLDPLKNRFFSWSEQLPLLPIEFNLTAPLQVFAAELPDQYRSSGFFDGDKQVHLAGLTMLEPYVPGRIPIIVVHGTVSVPETWLSLLAGLRSDPWLSQKYQVWFFRYPTSNPVPASATLLRDSIAAMVKKLDPQSIDPALSNMVLIGHSMGGLVARMAVINGNAELTQAIAPHLDLTKPTPDVIKRCSEFQSTKGIKRVIYIATPHHGVEMLDSFWLNRASSWLVLPEISRDLAAAAGSTDEMTSIQTMRPGSRFLTWLNQQPIGLHVHAHSLIANKESTEPSGTDGMVTYQSAHIEGVASELIIKSNHGSIHKNSEGVRELRRILELHLVE